MKVEGIENSEFLWELVANLQNELFEANSIIEAIREGAVDALVLNKDGQPQVYSMESADYTYRVLIEKFGEGALSITHDGLILYCNAYFSKLIGISADKITGTYFNTYVEDPVAFNNLKAGVESGPRKGEIVLNADGKKLHVYMSLSDLSPTVEAIGVVVTDLTEKRTHEEALVQYQQKLEMKVHELHLLNTNLEQFIHVISHDIKEPLRKMLTYTSHLSETKSNLLAPKELKSVNVINASATRLNSLVDDLVKYAFSANKADSNLVNLNKIFEEVTDDLELIIKERNAEIIYNHLPTVSATKVQMRQLFSNLLSNALKYARKDCCPRIEITSSIVINAESQHEVRQMHRIDISDNGIGMEKSQLNKIFTIFQRLHMRDEYSGNGIGLAICKKIMENHGGRIEVESTPGVGSVFSLYFPIL
ncbi:MAG TPA: ATP-binding protein [Flavobacterium sp.]|jgi:PAS domain S-box-containing protein